MPLCLKPWMEQLSIQKKDLTVEPLLLDEPFAWAQRGLCAEVERQYNAGLPVRIIVLKGRQVGVCLEPSTRVLTSDLRWVPLHEVRVGDELVGTDEMAPGPNRARRMRRTEVEGVHWVHEPAFKITLSSGVTITATGPHRFLCKVRGAVHTQWRPVDKMRTGDQIRYVTVPWSEERTYEDGWFSGMIDGEGCMARAWPREVTISQVFGPVYDRMVEYLKSNEYTFRQEIDERGPGNSSKFGSQSVARLTVGRMDEVFRLLGKTRPSRFVERSDWWEGRELPGKKTGVGWSRIVSIEPLPAQSMIDIQTSRATFIAEGLVSHNSTASEGILFNWTFLHPGTQSLVIAHDTKASQHLFGMAKLMWEEWKFRDAYHEKHNSQKSLGWLETRSAMSVSTAKNAGSGRSFTYHAVHCSEVAFWEDPERLMVGLNQSIPYKHGTVVIYESTANGVGNWFHEEWLRAVHKDSTFVPLFFPWYEHNEYEIPNTSLRQQDLLLEEEELAETYGLSIPKLAWRRHAIANLCMGDENQFHQEYPCTPDEAFLTTGTHIFPLAKLADCYEPKEGITGILHDDNGQIRFTPDPTGPLTIYTWPSSDRDWGRYVVAGDPSRTTYGDPACIQVINRRTFEQVAVWHGHIDPVPFAHEIMRLGYYYNDALINTEINGPGYGTIAIIMQLGYPDIWRHRWADKAPGKLSQSYGWQMSYARKHWAVSEVINLLAQGALTVHDAVTYDEMNNYVQLPGAEMGPASERGCDDSVTSLMIAVCSTMTEPPLTYGPVQTQANDLFDKPPWEAFG